MDAAPKQKKENRGLWTVVIVLAFMFFILLIFSTSLYVGLVSTSNDAPKVGVVEISGPIESSDKIVRNLMQFSDREDIQGVLIRLESPGGSVGASQEIYEAVKALNKPAIISMGNVAASGAYYIACAGPRIYANSSTLTGSIGVISQIMNVTEILDFLKLKVATIKTGPYKDSGSPLRPFTPDDEAYFSQLGLDIYAQFVDAVAEARDIPREEVLKLADGRVFTGAQAKKHKLVDELGGFYSAIQDLKKRAGIDGEVQLVYPSSTESVILEQLLRQGAAQIREEINSIQTPKHAFQYLYSGPKI
ncbi:MAG: signal peptide peptidase SppA [Bradymonadales bacterium]|jgi:protease-4